MNCKEIDNLLFDFIEGNLSFKKKRMVKNHLKNCIKCQTAFNQYKNLMIKLHHVPQYKCPDPIIKKVFDSIETKEERESILIKTYQVVADRISWKIGFAAAVAMVIFIIVVIYPVQQNLNFKQYTYTDEQVEQTKKEVELTLAYFHYYAKKTEVIIEQEALSKPIITPIKSTVEIAFKPLLNGGRL